MSQQELQYFTQSCQALIASQQTLLLSTASVTGKPDISYASFVRDPAGVFYIYISEMACHTANLMTNPQASILFIRSELDTHNLFVRERAVLNCSAEEISRNDAMYANTLDTLHTKFGETVTVLRSLSDFHLFALHPKTGRYVVGFGRAFKINVSDASLLPI